MATYTHDALNRVTSASYSIGGTTDQTIQFTYDSGANSVGRLTSASDANHSMSWAYDALGEVTAKTQTVGSIAKSVIHAYSNGDLVSETTPSGQTIAFTYANHQITGIAVNGAPLVSQVSYAPFGPVSGWNWGNGTSTARQYDGDGRVTSNTMGSQTASYTYYADGTLQSITQSAPTVYSTASGTTTLTVSGSDNQLTSTTGALTRSYSADAAGNVLSDGTRTFVYNGAARLHTATVGGLTTTYIYNALDQRVEKSNTNETTYFVYDEAGHLIGEYDGSGNLVEELVWLDDVPVASIRPNQSGGVTVFYIYTD